MLGVVLRDDLLFDNFHTYLVTIFCTDICRWRVVWRDSQWCLWGTSVMRRQASSWIESVKLQSSFSGKREVSEKTGEALQVTSTNKLKTMQIGNCRECGSANTSKRQPSKAPTSMSFLKSCSRWRRRKCSRCSRSRTRRRRRRNAASCNQRQRTSPASASLIVEFNKSII